jgi:3'-phosphoadenosine 5'-phosphosulfate sulfotransferase (PAPS reductase)/FAD synthetase
MPSKEELKMLQALPLEIKVAKTQQRIREWVEYFGEDGVHVSFSGGKDSTVLKHIVDQMGYDIPSVFVNTGLEFLEIQTLVREIKAGKYECFNSNVEIIRPKIPFREVLIKHGYPLISKRVADYIKTARKNPCSMRAKWITGEEKTKFVASGKWAPLIECGFFVSAQCCAELKHKPISKYEKETGRKAAIIGTTAVESLSRENAWLKNGCNAFNAKVPTSQPLSFWTDQDILKYIKSNNIPIASVYGDIVYTDDDGYEYNNSLLDGKLRTTGCDRTVCVYCGFGCHLDGEPSRFQRLKETHPRQYEYCIGGGEYDADGIWKPNKEGLGMGHVFDELNKIYGEGFIKYK